MTIGIIGTPEKTKQAKSLEMFKDFELLDHTNIDSLHSLNILLEKLVKQRTQNKNYLFIGTSARDFPLIINSYITHLFVCRP